MKASIDKIREFVGKERNTENEEDLLAEFEQLVDWIQGHDGGLSKFPLFQSSGK